jgi:hypothetical protein
MTSPGTIIINEYNFLTSGYLPNEIIINILMELDADSLKSLLLVCKFLREIIFNYKNIFIRNFIKIYPRDALLWETVSDNFLLGLTFQQFIMSNIFENMCIRNDVIILHSESLRELKMFYIMTIYYSKINPDCIAIDMSRLNKHGAYHYYLITSKYPDVVENYLDDIADDILWLIRDYENMDDFYIQIENAVEMGGTPSHAFHTICLNDYDIYYKYLEFGIPTRDAEEFSYSGYTVFSEEVLMTYKGLIPIIGKTFGVYFVLEMYLLYQEQNIIHILSSLYRNNITNVEIAELIINDYSEDFLQRVINMNHESQMQLLY